MTITAPWVDPDDAPPLGSDFFDKAAIKVGDTVVRAAAESPKRRGRPPAGSAAKVQQSLRLAPEVIAAFKAAGPGWHSRMEEALAAAALATPGKLAVQAMLAQHGDAAKFMEGVKEQVLAAQRAVDAVRGANVKAGPIVDVMAKIEAIGGLDAIRSSLEASCDVLHRLDAIGGLDTLRRVRSEADKLAHD